MSNKYSCVYSSLDNMNASESAAGMTQSGIQQSMSAGTPSMRLQTVPVYGGLSYEALTHDGRCTCGGHFTIANAYPDYGNNCTKFTRRLCSGDSQ
jgi:hypothetical protein